MISERTVPIEAGALLAANPDLKRAATGTSLFQELKDKARTRQVDGEELYIVAGDLLLDEDQLAIYALREEKLRDPMARTVLGEPGAQLLGIVRDGKTVRWEPGTILTYCVLRGTYLNAADYGLVRDNIAQATADWEHTCGVKFEYKPEFDNSPGTNVPQVMFPVRGFDAQGEFIAASFFPTDPASRRRMLIDPSYFNPELRFNKVGVLRHELGHVIGFRHEHIRSRAPAACPHEPLFGTTPLTAYDPQSVMHYFCGGVGSSELRITGLDREGSQKLYGPPLDSFIVVPGGAAGG